MNGRAILANRREGFVIPVAHSGQQCDVTYNFDLSYTRVRECFCTTASKDGTAFQALIVDGCIAISLLLQHGMGLQAIARAFGEDRKEGEKTGLPSSALGAIARAGIDLETEERAP